MIQVMQLYDKCIGCNACVEIDRFRWRISRNTGKCVLIDGTIKKKWYSTLVGDDEHKTLTMAVKNCPVNIIRIKKV